MANVQDLVTSEWNAEILEAAYRKANFYHQNHDPRAERAAMYAFRAAQNRDKHLLMALEYGANELAKMQERQQGETMRQASRNYSERVDLTEYSLWREAFVQADKGKALENLKWIYFAAAIMTGGITL